MISARISDICIATRKLGFIDMNCYQDNVHDGVYFRMVKNIINKNLQPEKITFELFVTTDLLIEKTVDEVAGLLAKKWNEEVKKWSYNYENNRIRGDNND